MLKSGNNIIQIWAVLVATIILIYGIYNKDILLIGGAIAILTVDIPLIIWDEKCVYTDEPIYDLTIRSGNKIIQFMAVIFGIYIIYNYNSPILRLIAIIMILGDGYLCFFEKHKICNYI